MAQNSMIYLEVISRHMTITLRIQHSYYAKLNAVDKKKMSYPADFIVNLFRT